MKITIKCIRISDKKEFVKTFKSKKECQRFKQNNYTEYTYF